MKTLTSKLKELQPKKNQIKAFTDKMIKFYGAYPQKFNNTLYLNNYYEQLNIHDVYFALECIHYNDIDKNCLSTILANLFTCYKRNHDNIIFHLYYSRDKNNFTAHDHLPYKKFIETIDILIENEFIIHKKEDVNSIFQSRMAPTRKMCEIFNKCKACNAKVKKEMLITQRRYDSKILTPYKEHKMLKADKNMMSKLNDNIKAADVCVKFPLKGIENHDMVKDIKMWAETKDFDYISEIVNSDNINGFREGQLTDAFKEEYILSSVQYIILFNLKNLCKSIIINALHSYLEVNETFLIFHLNVNDFVRKFIKTGSRNFTHAGRYYANIQQLPRDCRQYITINGNKTTELDYKCLHPSLLYAEIDIDYKEDAYLSGKLREQSKKTLLSMINDKNADDYNGRIVKELRIKHKRLAHLFGQKDKGIKLQNVDGNIATEIIKVFTKLNKVIIPIHDSFVVEENDRELLRECMVREYKKITGFEPRIDMKY